MSSLRGRQCAYVCYRTYNVMMLILSIPQEPREGAQGRQERHRIVSVPAISPDGHLFFSVV